MKQLGVLLFLFVISISAISQEEENKKEKEANLGFGADVVSRYILNGTDVGGNVPNIQPLVVYNYNGFFIGAWASFPVVNVNSNELDWFIGYSTKYFKIRFMDVFFPNDTLVSNKYFDYSENTTGHNFNASFDFPGFDNVPITLHFDVYFWGADTDANGDNRYSSYLELAYDAEYKSIKVRPFLGATFGEGFWGSKFGIVNTGIEFKKDVVITKEHSLPISAKFFFNPQAENAFFVFGLHL